MRHRFAEPYRKRALFPPRNALFEATLSLSYPDIQIFAQNYRDPAHNEKE